MAAAIVAIVVGHLLLRATEWRTAGAAGLGIAVAHDCVDVRMLHTEGLLAAHDLRNHSPDSGVLRTRTVCEPVSRVCSATVCVPAACAEAWT